MLDVGDSSDAARTCTLERRVCTALLVLHAYSHGSLPIAVINGWGKMGPRVPPNLFLLLSFHHGTFVTSVAWLRYRSSATFEFVFIPKAYDIPSVVCEVEFEQHQKWQVSQSVRPALTFPQSVTPPPPKSSERDLMAAAQTLEPRAFTSWEDAFQHPIPIVRKLEQQLRNSIDENRQKLRSLVGASYRDLLGTAERIIEMDEQMQTTERYLGGIGRKCNASAVVSVSENHDRMRKTRDSSAREKAGTIAQTKMLQSTLTAASRLIKHGGDALLAAKLWVLARLLGKSVSESKNAPAVLEDYRRKVVMLRKNLLSYIDRALVKTGAERTMLANALCAYALVTSSTPKDVLKHFLQTRYEQLDSRAETPEESQVLEMLDLYSQTLSDTRALFPRLFTDGMAKLENSPLLKDRQVSSLPDLNIDVYGDWIADDVHSFTPWVRHDQLTSNEVSDGLAVWAKQAQESLLQAVRDCLDNETDAMAVLGIRKSVLSRYITLGSKLQSEKLLQGIHEMREAFLERLIKLATEAAADIKLTLQGDRSGEAPPRSAEKQEGWKLATTNFDLSNGALPFRASLLRERHGRNDLIQSNCERMDRWIGALDGLSAVADHMRSTRWEDDLDFELDDPSDGELRSVFTKQDPDKLQTHLRSATSTSLHNLYTSIEQSAQSSLSPSTTLRLLREIDQRGRTLADRVNIEQGERRTSEMVSALYQQLAQEVLLVPQRQHRASLQKKPGRISIELWDGTPPLPVQPTPKTYKFLLSLQRAMSEVGSDLWSPAATSVLKAAVLAGLSESFKEFLSSLDASAEQHDTTTTITTTSDAEDASSENPTAVSGGQPITVPSTHHHVQTLFDVLYLHSVLSPGRDAAGCEEVIEQLKQRASVDEAADERLHKNAREYRKRTYLLFGLLAAHART
nr:hypothetical protein CFP56_28650 [Quercus suber]